MPVKVKVAHHDVELTHSSRYVIGRADNCDIQIKSKDISRYHCFLDLEGQNVFIKDMASGNGTFVNGKEITERYQLIKGDRLKLGSIDISISGYSSGVPAVSGDTDEGVPVETAAEDGAASAGPVVRRSAPEDPDRKLQQTLLRAGLAVAVIVVVLIVLKSMSGGDDKPERRDPVRPIARTTEEPDEDMQARMAKAQKALTEIKADIQSKAVKPWEINDGFDRLLAAYRGTPAEALIQREKDAFNAGLTESDKAAFYAGLDKSKQLKHGEKYFAALQQCTDIFQAKADLTDEEVQVIKDLITEIAAAAEEGTARYKKQAVQMTELGQFEEAVDLLNEKAALFGLNPNALLARLNIPPYSDQLTAEVAKVGAAKQKQFEQATRRAEEARKGVLQILAERRFNDAELYLKEQIAAIPIPKLRTELEKLQALTQRLAGVKARIVARANADPIKVTSLKGTVVKADAQSIFIKDAAEHVTIKLAWKNVSNTNLYHIIRMAGVIKLQEEKQAIGDYFFMLGDMKLARLYLKGADDGDDPAPVVGPVKIGSMHRALRAGRAWPVWKNYTAFMWFHGGPRKSANAYKKGLAYYGITAGNVQFKGDSSIEGGDPEIDFYVGDISKKGILHIKHQTQEIKDKFEYFKTHRTEIKTLVRPYCYNDPSLRQQMKNNISESLSIHKGNGPLAYSLGDEISSGSFVRPLNWCYCPHCLKLFRAWAAAKHKDIAALNTLWGTSFADFDQVIPVTLQETIEQNSFFTAREAVRNMRYPELNYASYNDFRTWRDINFAEVLKELVDYGHTIDPDVPIGAVGLQRPSQFGGYDYTRLVHALDWVEAYDIGEVREILRSFTTNDYPKVETHFIKNDAPEANKFRAWYYFMHGDRGVIIWSMGGAFTAPARGQNPKYKPALPFMKEAYTEFRDGLAAKIFAAEMQTEPIAIYYSQPSIRFHWFADSGVHGNTWVNRGSDIATQYSSDIRSRRAFIDILENSGYQCEFVAGRNVAEHGISLAEFKVLILPKTIAMSKKEADAIKAFVQAGGTVIADYQTGMLDENLKGRKEGALDDMFGIKRRNYVTVEWYDALAEHANWDYGLKKPNRSEFRGMMAVEEGLVALGGEPATSVGKVPAVIMNSFGKGKAYYLNLNMLNYSDVRFSDQARAESMRMIIDNIVREAGIKPPVEVFREGKFYPNMEKIIWKGKGEDYLFILSNASFRKTVSDTTVDANLDEAEHAVTIKLNNGKKKITRWFDKEPLGEKDQWKDLLKPTEPMIFILKN